MTTKQAAFLATAADLVAGLEVPEPPQVDEDSISWHIGSDGTDGWMDRVRLILALAPGHRWSAGSAGPILWLELEEDEAPVCALTVFLPSGATTNQQLDLVLEGRA